jgi:NAD(P)-dependent dehydrogenase (short-subunit alcohol dehydrogenase family)
MTDIFQGTIFQGKTAVITGGGSGINLRIAERFAEHGAHVALIGRTKEKLDNAVAGIIASGGRASAHAGDVRDYKAMDAIMAEVHQAHGEIDVLVCGAAGNFPAPAAVMSANGFKSVLDIDVLGTFHAARSAFERLRKPGAVLLNISAPQAYIPYPLQAHVCAAKAGVDMITRTLAMEWGPLGVRVNSIAPGPIDDTEGMRRLAPSEETRQKVLEAVPLKHFGSKDDIANLCLFVASPAGRYITGAVLVCDGGQSLMGGGAVALGF